MLKFVFAIFQFLIVSQTVALQVEYGLKASREDTSRINNFVIFSERCSGSNYLYKLIKSNFLINAPIFCHKHYPPWYDLPQDKWLGDPVHYNFEGTEDTLFFVIYRNPYDWLRSFHQQPFEAAQNLVGITFFDFIRTPWTVDPKLPVVQKELKRNPLVDLNPSNGKPFKNVMKLRTAKGKNMYKIDKWAKNTYFINYETVRDYPQEVLAELNGLFDLMPTRIYHPVKDYKGCKEFGKYEPKKYESISHFDLFHINSQLDEKFERSIGYKLVSDPAKIN